MTMFVGKSFGCGSLAIQLDWTMLLKKVDALIFFYGNEKANTKRR